MAALVRRVSSRSDLTVATSQVPAAGPGLRQPQVIHRSRKDTSPTSSAVLHAATPARARPVAAPSGSLCEGCPEDSTSNAAPRIQVSVRVRPVPAGDESIIEVAGDCAIAVRKEAGTGGNEFLKSQQGRTEERLFDRVFGPEASQAQVFQWSCQPLVARAVEEARSATVFVYGATGAGKTHTIFGEREDAHQGLIYRVVRDVFGRVEARAAAGHDGGRPLEVKVSMLDIYNESVRDLLQEGGALCKVLEDERQNIVKVTNLREVLVRCPEEVFAQMRIGMQNRKVEATAANARSSRSHAVFSLTLERVEAGGAGPGLAVFRRQTGERRKLHSKICLIDLAGSERATQTQNVGSALKDGAKINQSLLALANCIDALACHAHGHRRTGGEGGAAGGDKTPRRKVPFRDSKLTLLLKSSLTSECLVSMIANVHPGRDHFEDSNNTLEYAKRASVVRAHLARQQCQQRSDSAAAELSTGRTGRTRAASLPAFLPPGPPPSPPLSPLSAASSSPVGGVEDNATAAVRRTTSHDARLSHGSAPGAECRSIELLRTRPLSSSQSQPPACLGSNIFASMASRPSSFATAVGASARNSSQDSDSAGTMYRSIHTDDEDEDQPQQQDDACGDVSREPSLLDISTPHAPDSTPSTSQGSPNVLDAEALPARLSGRQSRHKSDGARSAGATPVPSSKRRSSRKSTPRCTSPSSKKSPSSTADVTVLLNIIRSLQEEKTGLDNMLTEKQAMCDHFQQESARLRQANLEKDKQLAVLLTSLHGRAAMLEDSASSETF